MASRNWIVVSFLGWLAGTVQWGKGHEFARANNISFVFLDDVLALRLRKEIDATRPTKLAEIPLVPDVPITVDAQLPDAPDKTLRERMKLTQQEYCWKCHQFMNPVGLPFEMYDYFGRYRDKEPLVKVVMPAQDVKQKKSNDPEKVPFDVQVDSSGGITFAHDARIEGDVKNAVEMLKKLATSDRVEQVFVRHAFRYCFRYWMGRNENLGDASSLQAAQKSYRENGGSMKALIVGLLSSDSFLYRTRDAPGPTCTT